MNQDIKIPFVDLYPQYEECRSDIDMAIADIITRSDYITGPTVDKFEQSICEYTGAEPSRLGGLPAAGGRAGRTGGTAWPE